ncbi:MAG: CDP-diacylglycerol--glycerol-3-phosphate 3-phosphatidyltransferase [Candidatus Omnitrophica bacterium]|nr:CDP-diacylglycerol--glycerol-3-phosphate 3-phosphatidyltransferase [Candidatus Omnitrophota bacterium]
MNLPNQLTLLRVALSFLLMVLLLLPGFGPKLAALVVFILASLTDLWDGRLARRWKLVTDFGVLMDPIADKILVLSAFLAFVQLNLVPAWMVALIATREFLITGLRIFALGKGQVLPAEAAGKHKTVSQMVSISLILLFLVARESVAAKGAIGWITAGGIGIWWLMMLTVTLTLTSGGSFLWRHRKLILNL